MEMNFEKIVFGWCICPASALKVERRTNADRLGLAPNSPAEINSIVPGTKLQRTWGLGLVEPRVVPTPNLSSGICRGGRITLLGAEPLAGPSEIAQNREKLLGNQNRHYRLATLCSAACFGRAAVESEVVSFD